jgi:hypothetical protein
MWWADTNDNVLKMRNSANNGWITLQQLDGTLLMEDGTEGSPGLAFRDDTDTGFFSPGANTLAISSGGTERVRFGTAGAVFNEGSNDVDFRVESNGQTHMLFVDGGTDCVGIGVSNPGDFSSKAETLVLAKGGDHVGITLDCDTDKEGSIFFADGGSGSNLFRGQIVYNHSGDTLRFVTNASERARINSSGEWGIGTTTPESLLEIHDSVSSDNTALRIKTYKPGIRFIDISTGSDDAEIVMDGDSLRFRISDEVDADTALTERMRLTGTGRLGIATTSPVTSLDVSGDAIFGNKTSGNPEGGQITLRAKNGSTGLANFDVDSADDIRLFTTTNNTNFKIGQLSGTGSALLFYTAGSERSRVDGTGNIYIHQSSTDTPGAGNTTLGASFENLGSDGSALFVSRSNNYVASFNRAQDGTIVQFNSAGNTEGTISISGSTTSYNGAHLSRWSQLAANAERIEILRGSVLSNLDEMCEWAHAAQDEVLWTAEDALPEGVSVGDVKTPARDAYTENNEQLNRMKVSDVEGDTNVAGVFQAWDDDDDTFTNDFYCAMTGDFVIRIAQGTTVARGDLLMSAGDGTAKPQDDDIVRSKTVAKVTSTTVSTTYADGSYCVPCVLMAC